MVRMGSGLRKRPHFGQTVVDGKLNSAGDGHGNYLSSSAFVDAAKADGVTKWFDNVYDVTIVKIDLANSDAFSPAKLEFSSKVRVGDLVFTYGFPQCYPRSLSMGIISFVTRTSSQVGTRGKRSLFFQIDCEIFKDTSVSPLVNLNGEVIGVIFGGIPDGQRIAFALREKFSLKGYCFV